VRDRPQSEHACTETAHAHLRAYASLRRREVANAHDLCKGIGDRRMMQVWEHRTNVALRVDAYGIDKGDGCQLQKQDTGVQTSSRG
jgi:hypothetical protein